MPPLLLWPFFGSDVGHEPRRGKQKKCVYVGSTSPGLWALIIRGRSVIIINCTRLILFFSFPTSRFLLFPRLRVPFLRLTTNFWSRSCSEKRSGTLFAGRLATKRSSRESDGKGGSSSPWQRGAGGSAVQAEWCVPCFSSRSARINESPSS